MRPSSKVSIRTQDSSDSFASTIRKNKSSFGSISGFMKQTKVTMEEAKETKVTKETKAKFESKLKKPTRSASVNTNMVR